MSTTTGEQRFELHLSAGPALKILRTYYRAPNQTEPNLRGPGKFGLGPGPIAFSLCFVKYRIWAFGSFQEEGFCFSGDDGQHPVTTLGNALEVEGWINDVFDSSDPEVSKGIFKAQGGDNRSGDNPNSPRTVRINGEQLSPGAVHIFCKGKEIQKKKELVEIASLLEKQWKLRSKPTSNLKAKVKEDVNPERKTTLQKPRITPTPRVFFQTLEEAVPKHNRTFSPVRLSHADYISNTVHCSSLLPTIKTRLAKTGFACIFGMGASGKTTLSRNLAFDQMSSRPSFFLNCGSDCDAAFEIQTTTELLDLARRKVLIVLDNAHQQIELTVRLFHKWQQARTTSHLLILSRETNFKASVNEHQEKWLNIINEGLRLEVREEDILGILRLIASRSSPKLVSSISPPAEALQYWHQLFAGDLLAFSIAVTERLPFLKEGNWSIEPENARTYVSDRYLLPLEEKERGALLRLAVLGGFEISIPSRFFGYETFSQSRRSGIVNRFDTNQKEGFAFRLAHPGLGRLLLAACLDAPDAQKTLNEFVEMFPHRKNIVHLMTRLSADDWGWLKQSRTLKLLYTTLLDYPPNSPEPMLDAALMQRSKRVIEMAINTPFQVLFAFLTTAEDVLPHTCSLLRNQLRTAAKRAEVPLLFLDTDGNDRTRRLDRINANHAFYHLTGPRDTQTKRFLDSVIADAMIDKCNSLWAERFSWLGIRFYGDFPAYVTEVQSSRSQKWLRSLLASEAIEQHAEFAFFRSAQGSVQDMIQTCYEIKCIMCPEAKRLFLRIFKKADFQRHLLACVSPFSKKRGHFILVVELVSSLLPAEGFQVEPSSDHLQALMNYGYFYNIRRGQCSPYVLGFDEAIAVLVRGDLPDEKAIGPSEQFITAATKRIVQELCDICARCRLWKQIDPTYREAVPGLLSESWNGCWDRLNKTLSSKSVSSIKALIAPSAFDEILRETRKSRKGLVDAR